MNRIVLPIPFLAFLILAQPMSIAAEVQGASGDSLHSQYRSLALGRVRPAGWLRHILEAQAAGLGGHLDEFWPRIQSSGWKGMDGDRWEDTPYFLNGVVPLAHLVDDQRLIAKNRVYIEWILNSQQEKGFFCPEQRNDTWSQTLALKTLISHHEATGDPRVMPFMVRYFQYLRDTPPGWQPDTWPEMRAMELGVVAQWLYRQTGDRTGLDVVRWIAASTFDWEALFLDFPYDTRALQEGRIPRQHRGEGMHAHGVNLVMALKYPALLHAIEPAPRHREAVGEGLRSLDRHHGQLAGRFSADDNLSGCGPDRGTELCTVVDEMFSLEKLFEVFADGAFADRLELLAYNALPASVSSDFWSHQYNQQSNQILVSGAERPWSSTGRFSNLFGLGPNYPSCLVNMHQGWPMFVRHLWMETRDGGVVAVAYAPCEVTADLPSRNRVRLTVETDYPFDEQISIRVRPDRPARFPIHLRIPGWAEGAVIEWRGTTRHPEPGETARLDEEWGDEEVLVLRLPMPVRTERRHRDAVAVARGPLYFVLDVGRLYREIEVEDRWYRSIDYQGSVDWEIFPTTQWNYGLVVDQAGKLPEVRVTRNPIARLPFSHTGEMVYDEASDRYCAWESPAPVMLKVPGRQVPAWGMKNNSADIPPPSPASPAGEVVTLDLIPYGCSRLRIAEFPWCLPE